MCQVECMPRLRSHEISIEMHSLQPTSPKNRGTKEESALYPEGEDGSLISFIMNPKKLKSLTKATSEGWHPSNLIIIIKCLFTSSDHETWIPFMLRIEAVTGRMVLILLEIRKRWHLFCVLSRDSFLLRAEENALWPKGSRMRLRLQW